MKNKRWSDKDVVVYSLDELPLRKKPHAWYYLLNERYLFKVTLLQRLFSQSRFHFHPVPETLFVLSGNLIIETDKGKKRAPSKSLIDIPANVIHRVKNDGPQPETQSIISIGDGWLEEDVVHVEKRGNEWVEIESTEK